MTARDRVRVMTKGYNSVVWFGNDYLWLASFQGLPTVISLVAQNMQKWLKNLNIRKTWNEVISYHQPSQQV